MSVFRYRLEADYEYSHPAFSGVNFDHPMINISGGKITISKGYAWNGCDRKFSVLGLFYIGTPDGALYQGRPHTYYASLVHDALCQFDVDIPIKKDRVVEIWNDMLSEVEFPLRQIYVYKVDPIVQTIRARK